MYTVIESFPDIQDKCHIYKVGDTYPRGGITPTEERIKELLGTTNGRGRPVIEEAKETKETETKTTGKATSKKKEG